MPQSEDRRRFIRIALVGGIAVVSGAVGAASVFFPPHVGGSSGGARRPLAPLLKLGALEKGAPLGLQISLSSRDAWRLRTRQQTVYILRVADGDDAAAFKAMSPICSHAGCEVEYHDADGKFLCACHGAEFDVQGAVTKGPAPRDLDVLGVSIAEHEGKPWLFVDWQEFVTGTPDSTPKGSA
ncbi:MAG: ubiquinol-cytochrome c reductase iron-sulfur subunit [Planctomycetes bacterium]|nr:ubiquinol-cytochrome c reductase iron-sulfur subunit [Planctomycetota bacterium]